VNVTFILSHAWDRAIFERAPIKGARVDSTTMYSSLLSVSRSTHDVWAGQAYTYE
jgi:hypothetical protein